MSSPYFHIPDEETLDGDGLAALQRRKLGEMLPAVLRTNDFYRAKFDGITFDAGRDALQRLPFTTRAELEQAQLARPPYGTNLTYPVEQYCRFHQTSGSGGRPLRWLDTPASWAWFRRCWGIIFAAAGVGTGDRVFFPFSFGPFVGFWGAFETASSLGLLSIPAGGLSTTSRLKMLLDNEATVVCCTPTYALHLAETARQDGVDLACSPVRALIVAGEPGGNIPETRQRIESAWGARVFDHSGMTEIGAMAFECTPRPGGLHVIESEYIAEVIDPSTGAPLPDGIQGELVLTNLGRWGSPLIRYRTGDQVRLTRGRCECGRCFARLDGGILGRTDDMFIVRGNNVFPPAFEAVVRRFPEVAEFRVTIRNGASLAQVNLEIEPVSGAAGIGAPEELCRRIARAVQETFNFRAEVSAVPVGALPRFEMKAKRFVRAP